MSLSKVQDRQKEVHETNSSLEPSWKGLYRVSGILLVATSVAWFVVSWTAAILYSAGYPSNPTAYLQLVSQNQSLASFTWSLWIVSDFLLIAPTVALYLVLRHYNRTLALLGASLSMFFNIYDVSITELNSLTLVSLSRGFASATNDALRASYIAAATYGLVALPLQTVLSFAVGTLGFLLWCVPMAKSIFGRRTAVFGAIASVTGILGAAGPLIPVFGILQFLSVPTVAFWFILVGFRLYRHSSQLAYMGGSASPDAGQPVTLQR